MINIRIPLLGGVPKAGWVLPRVGNGLDQFSTTAALEGVRETADKNPSIEKSFGRKKAQKEEESSDMTMDNRTIFTTANNGVKSLLQILHHKRA